MQAELTASDIACLRADRVLFRGVSFACAAGDALHVTGANGTGKSSLLRILAGLLRPVAGKVVASGSMGLVDERLALDANQPLGTALAFWARLDDARDVGETAAMLGLTDLLDVPVRYLSTGQKKRAALARLMASNCPIWLLDEPLNGLDTDAQARVEQAIADHRQGGGIAVLASHQPVALPDATILALADFSR